MKMKLLIVLGGGGHTAQMLKLVDLLGKKYQYEYITVKDDPLSMKKIKIKGDIYKISRARKGQENLFISAIRQIKSFLESFKILLNAKSKVIISCGPDVAVPVCFVGKILKKRIIFIETRSRIFAKSLSGKAICPIANLFFVQWPEMKKNYSKAIYAGRLE